MNRLFACSLVWMCLVCLALGQEPVISPAESEIATAAANEAEPGQRLLLLEQWHQDYPESQLGMVRAVLFLSTASALGLNEEIDLGARRLVDADPLAGGRLLCQVAMGVQNPTESLLGYVERVAGHLITQAELVLSAESLGATEEQWLSTKASLLAAGYRALGWVANNRSEHVLAEQRFMKALEFDSTDVQVSLALVEAIGSQADGTRASEVVYHLLRAGHYEGAGSLPEDARTRILRNVKTALASSGVTEERLEEVGRTAKVNPVPPTNFQLVAPEASQPTQVASQKSATSRSTQNYTYRAAVPEVQDDPISVVDRRLANVPWWKKLLADTMTGMAAGMSNRPHETVRERMIREEVLRQSYGQR